MAPRMKRQVGVNIEDYNTNSPKIQDIKSFLEAEKKPVKIPLLDHHDNHEICERFKSYFTNNCKHLPSTDATQLPSFLASFEPAIIDRITVYKNLLSPKVFKASPPNIFPKKRAQEFAS